MTTYLLDVHMLLALSEPMHVHHDLAHCWFAEIGRQSWATCPLTENGYMRVASHPRYPNRPGDVGAVLDILRQFCAAAGHQFWTEDISIRELIAPDTVLTHLLARSSGAQRGKTGDAGSRHSNGCGSRRRRRDSDHFGVLAPCCQSRANGWCPSVSVLYFSQARRDRDGARDRHFRRLAGEKADAVNTCGPNDAWRNV